jgi:glycosyltransferase involved in cell wall biosynthesis
VVYLGIDDEIYPSRTFGVGDEEYFFMMATSRRKNILTVMDAYAEFRKKNPQVRAKILLNNNYMFEEVVGHLNSLGIPKGSVDIITDYTSKETLSKLYQKAICFVYCPVYEGFGLPVLEAMKCHCPVITSSTSSLPEIAGTAAIQTNPQDHREIAKAMDKVYSSITTREKMVHQGNVIANKFDWKESARTLYRVILSIL